jgi:Fe-S-cluster containining protein
MNVRAPSKVKFECQRCARCCGDTPHRGRIIYLLENEVNRITKNTGLHTLEFASPISGMGNYSHKIKKRNGVCIFLKNKACRIYNAKPAACELYPFSVSKNNSMLVFDISEDCPGIGLGECILDKEFTKLSVVAKSIFD